MMFGPAAPETPRPAKWAHHQRGAEQARGHGRNRDYHHRRQEQTER